MKKNFLLLLLAVTLFTPSLEARYINWVGVSLEHAYFTDGRPHSRLVCEPTHDCRMGMNGTGQFFYTNPSGFSVLYDKKKIPSVQDRPAEGYFFDIAVFAADPTFLRYSNLDIEPAKGQACYVGHGIRTGAAAVEKGLTLVEPDGRTIEAVPVRLQPKQFVLPLEGAVPGAVFKLLDKWGSVVLEKQVKAENETDLHVDFTSRPSGIYSLEKNGKVVARFYADDRLFLKKPVFIIGIKAGHPGAWGGNLNVRVNPRPVTWEYHISAHNGGNRRLEDLTIRNNNKSELPGISFELFKRDAPKGTVVFISNKPIPIKEQYYRDIQLLDKSAGGTPLIPHLPNANASSLHLEKGKWVAKMTVHI